MLTPFDSTSTLIEFYGNPSAPGWVAKNLVLFTPPWVMTYKDDNGKITAVHHFEVHRKIADAMHGAFDRIWKAVGQTQEGIQKINLHWYGGCFNPRNIRGSSRMSCHSFAAAIDLDPEHNCMNREHITHMAPEAIAAFKAEGAFWGGDFKSRQDPMHFQFAHE